jgi:predicted AlkP superfamily phosphohydrolase/phosphomutase
VQHKFWQFMDTEHFPDVDPRERRLFGGVIEGYYRYYDRLVGRYVERAEPGTTFILVSDHGMEPIQAQGGRSLPEDELVYRNMSLYRPVGILRLLEQLGLMTRSADDGIDWNRTIAFPNGDKALTWEVGICLNVEGREPRGAVNPEDYDRVLAETASTLKNVRADLDGAPLFVEVEQRPHDSAGEIVARVNPGLPPDTAFTIDDRTFTLESLLEQYDMSGAHLFAPDGIMLVAGPAVEPASQAGRTTIYDVAPLVCRLLGLPLPEDYVGTAPDIWADADRLPASTPVPSFRGLVPGFDATGGWPDGLDLEPMSAAEEERLRSLGYIQ